MELEQLQAKFRGALLGVAVGDALGAPFEGTRVMPHRVLDRLVRDPGPMRYTDDTHMTLGLAASLLERQGFHGNHMATAFAQNFAAEPWRGYGPGPPQVFHRLRQGVPWDEAGQALFGGAGSFGNGGAMRVAPVALFGFADLPQVSQLARHTAMITHTHHLCR
jgi:poly(ADP-ribose) glycohydrolase ARH3